MEKNSELDAINTRREKVRRQRGLVSVLDKPLITDQQRNEVTDYCLLDIIQGQKRITLGSRYRGYNQQFYGLNSRE